METKKPTSTIERRIDTARLFITYFENLLADNEDPDAVDDLAGLHTVARAYLSDLQRVRDGQKLDHDAWINVRNGQLLAEVLIHELHETEDLSDWYFGIDPGENMLFAVATFVTEAHLQLVETMMTKNARRRDFVPFTDEELAAVERLLS